MRQPIIQEVASQPSPIAFGQSATATTPTCPGGTRMVTGGFSSGGSTDSLFAQGSFNPDGTFSAMSYGFFGATPQLTAYGYCLPAKS
jgi:hypothetical protein